jgi:DNA-binding transcriptional MerR regulator
MANMTIYSLEELAQLTGLSPRTIRNYIQKGLLPGAETRGRNASYTELHLNRLQCIQIIRDKSGLPLDELRLVMQSLSEEQIQSIATRQEEVMALPIGRSSAAEPQHGSSGKTGQYSEYAARAPAADSLSMMESMPENSNALQYIRQIKQKQHHDKSRFVELVRILEGLIDRQRVYRKAKNEWWATVKITEDMEIRVRGLDEKDIGQLERLADLLRHLLMKGV